MIRSLTGFPVKKSCIEVTLGAEELCELSCRFRAAVAGKFGSLPSWGKRPLPAPDGTSIRLMMKLEPKWAVRPFMADLPDGNQTGLLRVSTKYRAKLPQ